MPVLPVAIAVALGIVLLLRKARFHYERLPKIPYVSGATQPDAEIIVREPGDAELLERTVHSFPPEIVTVVADQSLQLAQELGVRVVPPGGLPVFTAEWLFFTGADSQYARVFLPSLAQYAMEENLDAVSVFLKHVPRTLTEKMVLPYSLAMAFTGLNSARLNSQPPGALFASANCLLIRREAYEQLGGLDGLARAKWVRGRLVRAEHMGTAATGSFRYLMADAWSRTQVALASVLLTAWLPVVALLAWHGYGRQAVLFALAPSLVLFPWYRGPAALLAPLATWLFNAQMLHSMSKGRGGPAPDRRGQGN